MACQTYEGIWVLFSVSVEVDEFINKCSITVARTVYAPTPHLSLLKRLKVKSSDHTYARHCQHPLA